MSLFHSLKCIWSIISFFLTINIVHHEISWNHDIFHKFFNSTTRLQFSRTCSFFFPKWEKWLYFFPFLLSVFNNALVLHHSPTLFRLSFFSSHRQWLMAAYVSAASEMRVKNMSRCIKDWGNNIAHLKIERDNHL